MDNYNSGQGQGWPNQPNQPPGYEPWRPQRERMEPILLTAMIILAIVLPFIGPLVAIVVGAVNNRKIGGGALVGVGAVVFLLDYLIPMMFIFPMMFVAAPNLEKVKLKAKEAEIKQTVHALQLGIESHAEYNEGVYPKEILNMVDVGYEKGIFIPNNPLTGERMRDIPFGTENNAGEFSYIPVKTGDTVTGYYLLTYGFESTQGEDVNKDGTPDHVILVFSSVEKTGKPLSPLEELLKK